MCGHTRITNRRSEMQQGLFVILIIGWRHIETKCFSRRIRAIDCSVKRIWPKLWELHARHSTGGLRTAGWKDAPHAHFRMENGAIRQTQSVKHWKIKIKLTKQLCFGGRFLSKTVFFYSSKQSLYTLRSKRKTEVDRCNSFLKFHRLSDYVRSWQKAALFCNTITYFRQPR